MPLLPRFIQIHTLHNYSATLLNRDDAGLAKRLPYGDAIRTRISSQCLKRHWRVADDHFSLGNLGVDMAVRSRSMLDLIRQRIEAAGVPAEVAQCAAEGLRSAGLLDKPKESKGKEALETGQAVLLGVAEINYFVKLCVDLSSSYEDDKSFKASIASALKDQKENVKALKHGSGLESALFGRMVTSDVLTSRDASVYVAHAFTVHEAQVENDYFTVVDDLKREAGEQGSAGIFDTELSSGLYYGYTVIDVPQLIANLEGENVSGHKGRDWAGLTDAQRQLAGRVVQHLLHLMATVSPGAKRGSTAPFEWAKLMLVEAGDWQPRSLAGAFHTALVPDGSAPLVSQAAERLGAELSQLDAAYGAPLARRFLSVEDVALPGATRLPLADLSDWARDVITRAKA